jgi:hypothetical protein
MRITIHIRTDGHRAPGKLADAEIHFSGGELDGLKLVGFAVWKSSDGGREFISFPTRHFVSDGERHAYRLLRWIETQEAFAKLETALLDAYQRASRNGNGAH